MGEAVGVGVGDGVAVTDGVTVWVGVLVAGWNGVRVGGRVAAGLAGGGVLVAVAPEVVSIELESARVGAGI